MRAPLWHGNEGCQGQVAYRIDRSYLALRFLNFDLILRIFMRNLVIRLFFPDFDTENDISNSRRR